MDILIQRAKVQLLLNRPFYGSLVARLQLRDWEEDTFATDGQYLYCPPKHNFKKEELEFIVAHETLHCALQHMFRRGNRDPFKWNVACDFAVNGLLRNDRFVVPQGSLYDQRFAGKSAEAIYDMLPPSLNITLMMRDLLEGAGGKSEKEQDGKAKGKTAEEIQQGWTEALASAIEIGKGDLPSEFKELINSFLFPKIPWQQLLFRYLQVWKGQQDFKSYPFNRAHIYRNVFLPSLQGESIDICVAYDTSGSMSKQEISEALSEVRGICSTFGSYTIHLMECDADLHNVIEVTEESDVPNIAQGRGGTDFRPVFKLIQEQEWDELPLIFFTDLEGNFPKEPKEDTFWIVPKRSAKHSIPFGEKIILE